MQDVGKVKIRLGYSASHALPREMYVHQTRRVSFLGPKSSPYQTATKFV